MSAADPPKWLRPAAGVRVSGRGGVRVSGRGGVRVSGRCGELVPWWLVQAGSLCAASVHRGAIQCGDVTPFGAAV